MDIYNSPLVKRELIALIKNVKKCIEENNEFILQHHITKDEISLKSIKNFYFKISSIRVNTFSKPLTTECMIEYFPNNSAHQSVKRFTTNTDNAKNFLYKWIYLVKEDAQIDQELEELLGKHTFEDSFVEYVMEEGAEDVSPLLLKQDAWIFLLNEFSTSLENHREKYPVDDIIAEVKAVQRDEQNLPVPKFPQLFKKWVKKLEQLHKDAVQDIVKDGMKEGWYYLFGVLLRLLFGG
jgi:hypothetical protein